MKVKITIECDCGNNETVLVKRTLQEFEGEVYEDYSDIIDGFKDSVKFEVGQSHPDAKDVKCLNCKREHEIV